MPAALFPGPRHRERAAIDKGSPPVRPLNREHGLETMTRGSPTEKEKARSKLNVAVRLDFVSCFSTAWKKGLDPVCASGTNGSALLSTQRPAEKEKKNAPPYPSDWVSGEGGASLLHLGLLN